jgi:tetratricopeptide (TPR) repeat protein
LTEVVSRTLIPVVSGFSRTLIVVCTLWPTYAHAQAKDAFVEGLTQLMNAVDGTFGDEGPALRAAVEAMSRGLAAWDARVAGVESGFRADVTAAPSAGAAVMRGALGTVYLERGRVDDALTQFAAAAELDRSLAQVHVLRGLTYERSNRDADAAAAYRAAWDANPADGATAYLVLQSNPSMPAALEALRAAVLRRIDAPTSWSGGFPVAGLLDEASVAAPMFAPSAYGPAFTLIRQGKYDEALASLKAAVAADPLVTDRGLQLEEAKRGIVALREKNLRLAIVALDAAVGRSPESAELYRILGVAFAANRQYDRSLSHLQQAVRLNPRDDRARIAMADVLVASGKPEAALDVLRQTVRDLPDSAEAEWQLGRIEQALGDPDAVKSFERAATKTVIAGLARLYAIVGQAYHAQFDLDGAAAAYRQRVRIAPNDRDAHVDLAEVYRAQDRLDEARIEYLAAALIDPAHARTFSMIGQVETAAGHDEDALVMLRRAVTLDAGQLEARYALSRALLRLGRSEEAQQELRAFEAAQAKAMDEQRRQFLENQQKIDDVLEKK